jgi:hypothetical protein
MKRLVEQTNELMLFAANCMKALTLFIISLLENWMEKNKTKVAVRKSTKPCYVMMFEDLY